MLDREALHVGFKNYGAMPGSSRRRISSPGKGRIDHDPLQYSRSAVPAVEGKVFMAASDFVTEKRVVPPHAILNLPGIRIEQKFMAVKPQSFCRIVSTVHTVSIYETWASFRQIAVPHLVGIFRHENAISFSPAGRVEKAQLYFFRALGKEREIHSFAVPGGSQRIGFTRPNYQPRMSCRCAYHERSGNCEKSPALPISTPTRAAPA